MTKPLPKLVK